MKLAEQSAAGQTLQNTQSKRCAANAAAGNAERGAFLPQPMNGRPKLPLTARSVLSKADSLAGVPHAKRQTQLPKLHATAVTNCPMKSLSPRRANAGVYAPAFIKPAGQCVNLTPHELPGYENTANALCLRSHCNDHHFPKIRV